VKRPGWSSPAVLGVAGVALSVGFAQFAMTASLDDIAEEFGDPGAGELAMAGTTVGLGLALIRLASIASLPAAGLADRYGRRRVLLTCATVGLAVTAAAALSPGFWSLVVVLACARPLLSACNAVAGVVAAEETNARDRSSAVALVGGAYAAGTGLVAVVRAVGADAFGFRGVFALALLPLLALPLLAPRLRESPLFDATARQGRLGAVRRDLRSRLAVICTVHLAVGIILGPVYTYLFLYGEGVVGASPAAMAVLVMAAGPSGLVGLLLGRWLADHLGRRPTAGGTMALAAVTATVTYAGGFAALAAGYLLTIALGAAYTPAAATLDAELFPTEDRATTAGWVSAAQIVGQVIGLAGFGVLQDQLGSFSAAAAVLFLPVCAVPILYRFVPETRGTELDGAGG
jgi:predicted MFS family arabinose efflux permease